MLLICNKYEITPHAIFAGTRGSYGAEALELALSPDWEGLAVRLCFYPADGSAGVTVAYSGSPVTIPAEATAASGYGRLTVVGTRGETVMITLAVTLVVADTPQPADAQPAPPTATEYAQLRDLINVNIGVAEEIQTAAETAQSAAEAAQAAAEQALANIREYYDNTFIIIAPPLSLLDEAKILTTPTLAML